jgi:hypothetical protein
MAVAYQRRHDDELAEKTNDDTTAIFEVFTETAESNSDPEAKHKQKEEQQIEKCICRHFKRRQFLRAAVCVSLCVVWLF